MKVSGFLGPNPYQPQSGWFIAVEGEEVEWVSEEVVFAQSLARHMEREQERKSKLGL